MVGVIAHLDMLRVDADGRLTTKERWKQMTCCGQISSSWPMGRRLSGELSRCLGFAVRINAAQVDMGLKEVFEGMEGNRSTKSAGTELVSVLRRVSWAYQQVERIGERPCFSSCVGKEEGRKTRKTRGTRTFEKWKLGANASARDLA